MLEIRTIVAAAALVCALQAQPAAAGNWREFRKLVPAAVECVRRHPGLFPKLESNVRKYQHRLAEADAIAAASPALADRLVTKPLRQLREELAKCEALDARPPSRKRRRP